MSKLTDKERTWYGIASGCASALAALFLTLAGGLFLLISICGPGNDSAAQTYMWAMLALGILALIAAVSLIVALVRNNKS